MLVDTATILVRSGKGGDGHVSFLRMKYIPKGGPNGGDGGHGGSVIVRASNNVSTLLDLASQHHWTAKPGESGGSKQCIGKSAPDLIIQVPVGTFVYDAETDELLSDLDEIDKEFCAAKGGAGGFGNERFKTATNQTPIQSTPGEPGETRRLRFELKLIADVGLVGMPNAGKSTLLAGISHATPKIANYPFTTLEPNLGIAELSGYRRLVFADIPGLIEGAHDGHGLGVQFLRHVERTSVLVHVLEIEPMDGSDPIDNYLTIRRELAEYSPELAAKPQVVGLSKMDLLPTDADRAAAAEMIHEKIQRRVIPFSTASRHGLDELLEACWDLAKMNEKTQADSSPDA